MEIICLPIVITMVSLCFLLFLFEEIHRNLVNRLLDDPKTIKKMYDQMQKEKTRREQPAPKPEKSTPSVHKVKLSESVDTNPPLPKVNPPEPEKKKPRTERKSPMVESFERAENEGKRLKKRLLDELESYDE